MRPETTSIPFGYCRCGCGRKTNIIRNSHAAKGHVKGQPRSFIRGHQGRQNNGALIIRETNTIVLTLEDRQGNDYHCFIDIADYPLIAKYRWSVSKHKRGRTFYAQSRTFGQKFVRMHNILRPDLKMVDHKDRNGLNNRQSNLRPASALQNAQNHGGWTDVTSKYKGVHWYKRAKRWRASIGIGGKTHGIGYFVSEEDAARAYDVAALKVQGEYAVLNFPKEQS